MNESRMNGVRIIFEVVAYFFNLIEYSMYIFAVTNRLSDNNFHDIK